MENPRIWFMFWKVLVENSFLMFLYDKLCSQSMHSVYFNQGSHVFWKVREFFLKSWKMKIVDS